MKSQKKNRIKIENLNGAQSAAEPREMSTSDLRLVTGGLMRLEPCSCTLDCDVDCD